MLTAEEYRKRNRKTITLPSGGEVEIRKLSLTDFIKVGDIPAAFASGDDKEQDGVVSAKSRFATEYTKVCLTCGVTSMRIVDKSAWDCGPGEFALEEIAIPDQLFIAKEITKFNNLFGGAGEGIARFQEEQGPTSND